MKDVTLICLVLPIWLRSNTKNLSPVHPSYKEKTAKEAANIQECVKPDLFADNAGATDNIVDGKQNTIAKVLIAEV